MIYHVIIEKGSVCVHLVILYNMKGSFLWHGPMRKLNGLDLHEDIVQYGAGGKQGAFDW